MPPCTNEPAHLSVSDVGAAGGCATLLVCTLCFGGGPPGASAAADATSASAPMSAASLTASPREFPSSAASLRSARDRPPANRHSSNAAHPTECVRHLRRSAH